MKKCRNFECPEFNEQCRSGCELYNMRSAEKCDLFISTNDVYEIEIKKDCEDVEAE